LFQFILVQDTFIVLVDNDLLDSASCRVLVWQDNAIIFLLQRVELVPIVASFAIILAKLEQNEIDGDTFWRRGITLYFTPDSGSVAWNLTKLEVEAHGFIPKTADSVSGFVH